MSETKKRGFGGDIPKLNSDYIVQIPSTVLKNREISVLEAISYYLKEKLQFNFHEIGILLNRDERTIWTCHNRAKKKLWKKSLEEQTFSEEPGKTEDKRNKKEEIKETLVNIPSTVLQDRNVAVLESISEYLKDKLQFSYHEIAVLLNRNDRTIWTCYNRATKKRGGSK